jgi:ABC-type multidrug transport system fused ATPase/permease subunit
MRAALRIVYIVTAGSRLLFGVAFIANLVVAQFPVLLAYTTKAIVDSLISVNSGLRFLGHARGPIFFGGLYLGLLVLQYIGQVFLMFLNETLSEKAAKNIHVEIIKTGIRLEGISYFDNPDFHNQRTRLENTALYIPANFLRFATDISSIAVTLFGMIILLIGLHPLIPFLIVISCIPDVLTQKRTHRLIYEGITETASDERKKDYYRSVLLSEEHAKEVRIYNLRDLFIDKYKQTVQHIAQLVVPIRKQQVARSVVSRIILSVGTVMPYLWALEQAVRGRISPGHLVMFMTAIVVIQQQLARAAQTFAAHQDVIHAAKDLSGWLELKPDLQIVGPDEQTSRQLHEPPHVRVENLWFKYPGATNFTLKGLNLEIEKGKSLAIVGRNGSGKTTLVKLLCRLYDPQEGSIQYDDVNIRVISLQDLRGSTGIIFQDFMRYRLTVRENIALEDNSSFKNVYAAAVTSGSDTFVENLPESYETLLGKQFASGQELSGGQWQRLALARAFYRTAGMLILDEPTASVDIATEAKIYADFRAMTEGRTALLISHRLSTVRIADKIAVIDDGKVVESGSHDELMELRGLYYDMFLTQADRYRLSDASTTCGVSA